MENVERLDKIISSRTRLSRKEVKLLFKSGEVLLNGEKPESDDVKCSFTDIVTVSGKVLDLEKYVYYMMNKPAGVLCATDDKNCETVLDLLPLEMLRKGLFPAGRLDKDTEGFVLITDDGGFAHKILSPKNHVPKKYYAELNGKIPASLPEAFKNGLDIGGGDICSPAEILVLEDGWISKAEIVIYEGMYHQIKRMFMKFSLEVKYLKRLSIGGLTLDPDLPPGGAKKIMHKEIALFM